MLTRGGVRSKGSASPTDGEEVIAFTEKNEHRGKKRISPFNRR